MKKVILCLGLGVLCGQYSLANGPVISEGPVNAPPIIDRMAACFNTQVGGRCEMAATSQLRPVRSTTPKFMVAVSCGPQKIVEHFLVQEDPGPQGCDVTQLTQSFVPQN